MVNYKQRKKNEIEHAIKYISLILLLCFIKILANLRPTNQITEKRENQHNNHPETKSNMNLLNSTLIDSYNN